MYDISNLGQRSIIAIQQMIGRSVNKEVNHKDIERTSDQESAELVESDNSSDLFSDDNDEVNFF